MIQDFKKFLIGGNVVDMAVGFMFGGAFATIVKSLVDNIIMPPIGLLLGKVDFSNLFLALDGNTYANIAALDAAGAPAIRYGAFINNTVSFLILGFIIFMMVRFINKLKKKADEVPAAPAADIVLLTEIRDALAGKK
jgi:large conductance mechanosensitive channel